MYNRFNKESFSKILFHPSRMDDLEWLGKQEPATVFVGSMSDIEYWPDNLTQNILDEIGHYPKHTFMFLSKNPNSYGGWRGLKFPANSMQGLTLEKCDTAEEHKKLALIVGNCKRPFVSLEPIQGLVSFDSAWQVLEKIIIGAMTGPGAITPKQEWIDSIQELIPRDRIFWKKNIKKIEGLKIMDDKIYYCSDCAIRIELCKKLPLRTGELAGGYCRLCGIASPYVGYITQKEADENQIKVPTLDELGLG
jgi:protein gp37